MMNTFKKILLFLIGVSLIVCYSSCRSNSDMEAQQKNESVSKHDYTHYQDGIFGFSVDFPVTWFCESEPYYYATESAEGSPDSGVKIYIDIQKENYIRVYGQHGTITTSFVVQSNYTKIIIDETCELYIKETDDMFSAQLFFKDNAHISAKINMMSNVYKEHEEDIMNLLKSITWNN